MEDSKQGLININEANVEELCTLPGVGESLAERISAARPFEYLEDLEKVSGIGSNFVERLGRRGRQSYWLLKPNRMLKNLLRMTAS